MITGEGGLGIGTRYNLFQPAHFLVDSPRGRKNGGGGLWHPPNRCNQTQYAMEESCGPSPHLDKNISSRIPLMGYLIPS